jgi:hypothetical protein
MAIGLILLQPITANLAATQLDLEARASLAKIV